MRSIIRRISNFKPVQITYEELMSNKDLSEKIEEAYGLGGLGILTVEEIPDYHDKRLRLLNLSRHVALLPQSEKEKLRLPHIKNAIG